MTLYWEAACQFLIIVPNRAANVVQNSHATLFSMDAIKAAVFHSIILLRVAFSVFVQLVLVALIVSKLMHASPIHAITAALVSQCMKQMPCTRVNVRPDVMVAIVKHALAAVQFVVRMVVNVSLIQMVLTIAHVLTATRELFVNNMSEHVLQHHA